MDNVLEVEYKFFNRGISFVPMNPQAHKLMALISANTGNHNGGVDAYYTTSQLEQAEAMGFVVKEVHTPHWKA